MHRPDGSGPKYPWISLILMAVLLALSVYLVLTP